MPKQNTAFFAFNRGLVSPLALARTDLERLAISAETYSNWMPRALGSMMLRPGAAQKGATASNNTAKFIPFVFSTDDLALIEVTNIIVRVWVSDALVTRAAVTAAIANGTFTTDLTSWTDSDEAGGVSAWVTGGYLGLTGDGTNAAIRRQQVTVNETSTEHALAININRGPVTFRCGSASGTDDYISETILDTGYHSLAFTPTGDFHVEFSSRHKRQTLVASIAVESSGVMTITAPWTGNDLSNIRYDQSGDIVYIAAANFQQYKIERRGTTSWSVVKYYVDDGPFDLVNTGATTITPSVLTGNGTITSSTKIFKLTNVGSLYRITSDGQTVTSAISTADNWTSTIRVTGVTTSRVFTITRAGTWSGTVTLQRSLTASTGPWEDVTTYTTNATISFDDGLDNQIAWYRIGVKSGEFNSATITGITQANPGVVTTSAAHGFTTGEVTGHASVVGMTEVNGQSYTITVLTTATYSIVDTTAFTAYVSGGTATSEGPVTLTLDYPLGNIDGIVRTTGYTSETVMDMEVITDLGGTAATDDWAEGAWSDRRGWPTAVVFAEGRIVWSGKDSVKLSVSDNFTSFDDETVGDSGPISRTIGSGPVDTINWLVAVRRLLMGAEGAEFVCRSNGDDEPLTPTNFNIKSFSSQGSGGVAAVKVDNNVLYIQRGGIRLIEAAYGENFEYQSRDLTVFYPDIGDPGFSHIAVQRQPDTRIHCVRSDGTVAILIYDSGENVLCWVNYTTDGQVEDVVILPGAEGDGEDAVYYVVRRTINGSVVRYLEKWALESQCQGGSVSRQMDSHIVGSQASSTTISGLGHLEGESVILWANGKDLGTYTVASSAITASEAVTDYCVGLTYTAQFKSTKLAYAAGLGTALTQKKKVNRLGLILYNTHYQGLTYGPDFNTLDNLPLVENGIETTANTVHSTFDEESFFFNGNWDADSRLCLQAVAPKPVTVLASVISIETHDKY